MNPIYLRKSSDKLLFLIHGYTGSPTDFNGLPEFVFQKYNVDVKVPLLPGHGTKIQDLDSLRFKDFYSFIEDEFKKTRKEYKQVIIGGVSFGAQLALLLASRYRVHGVFTACLPLELRFPFNVPGIQLLGFLKKYWAKRITQDEQLLRKEAFHYTHMHANGLNIVTKANKALQNAIPLIQSPVLSLHSIYDRIGHEKGFEKLETMLKVPHFKKIYTNKNHNLFFSESKNDAYHDIDQLFTNA